MRHLALAIAAALMVGSVGASAAGAAGAKNDGRVDRHIHQHQGIGPTSHHPGAHRH